MWWLERVAEELRHGELHIAVVRTKGAGDGVGGCDVCERGVFDGECDGDATTDAFANGGIA